MKPEGTDWITYLRRGFGVRLSRLGERTGIDALTYNPLLFYSFHEFALRDAPGVARGLRQVFPEAGRWVDVGAGSGVFAAEARRQGIDALACEHSAFGRWMAARQGVRSVPFDLARTPPARLEGAFDLAYCFEVAEHLPPALGDRLVEFLSGLAPVVVFTAAPPGQGGTGHINEQPPSYWIERFGRQGMEQDEDAGRALREAITAHKVPSPWFRENIHVFRGPGGRAQGKA